MIFNTKSYVVAISGGSCSGKTTLTKLLQKRFGEDICQTIYQDSYYYDQSLLFDRDGGAINFDHPRSLEFSLLAEHIESVKLGNSVRVPQYDFVTHGRSETFVSLQPKRILLVDGILLLSQPSIREVVDFSIFVDTRENLRLERRLERDVRERGRIRSGVQEQFDAHVKPMHDLFVEPSRQFADLVIEGTDLFKSSIEGLLFSIQKKANSLISASIPAESANLGDFVDTP